MSRPWRVVLVSTVPEAIAAIVRPVESRGHEPVAVDAAFDTGAMLAQGSVPVDDDDHLYTIGRKLEPLETEPV